MRRGTSVKPFLLRFADQPLDLLLVQQQPAARKRLVVEGPAGPVLRNMAIHQPHAVSRGPRRRRLADWPCLRAAISPRCRPRPCPLPSFRAGGSCRRRRDSGQRLPRPDASVLLVFFADLATNGYLNEPVASRASRLAGPLIRVLRSHPGSSPTDRHYDRFAAGDDEAKRLELSPPE